MDSVIVVVFSFFVLFFFFFLPIVPLFCSCDLPAVISSLFRNYAEQKVFKGFHLRHETTLAVTKLMLIATKLCVLEPIRMSTTAADDN